MIFITGDIHGTIDIDKVIHYFSNEELIKNLTKQDYLILLGDTSICWDDGWAKNHELQKYFVSIDNYLEFSDGKNYLVLSHYPMLSYHRESRRNTYMIHGHIHADTDANFFPLLANRERILNAGVDINGFAPSMIKELIENNKRHKINYTIQRNDIE